MRIVFMGTPDFAVETLRALAGSRHEVVGVVTQPDKPRGRSRTLLPPPVKEEALKYGIPVYQPEKVREPSFCETLAALRPDAIIVAAFGQMIPRRILELPVYGCLNVHASLLPKYRGAAPIQWAVIDGEKESGVTIMRMDEGLDTGDMAARAAVVLDEEETGGSLFDKLSHIGAQLMLDTLEEIERGTVRYEQQPSESPTKYAAMLEKKMGLLNWEADAWELDRLIRGLNPWPCAYTFLNGRTLKIWQAKPAEYSGGEEPGSVLRADKTGLLVACGSSALRILRLQLEGKKQMEADAFLRGYPLKPGTKLGTDRE